MGSLVSTSGMGVEVSVTTSTPTCSFVTGGFCSVSMFRRSSSVESTSMAFFSIMGSGIDVALREKKHYGFEHLDLLDLQLL